MGVDFAILLTGIIVLFLGAEILVRGASRLSASLGVPIFIIGVTVVAVGTSAPELIACLIALKKEGAADLALGNIIGSNIVNIGLVMGVASLMNPVKISPQVRYVETPVMIVTAILLAFFMLCGFLSFWVGVFFVFLLLVYMGYQWKQVKKHQESIGLEEFGISKDEKLEKSLKEIVLDSVFIVAGFGLLFLGGDLLIKGAVNIAHYFNISERVIGLSVVAGGTSCPELATIIVASFKKHDGISLGNVIGSNIFNVLFVLGVCLLFYPFSFSYSLLYIDIPIMLGFSLLLWGMMWKHVVLSRFEGFCLIVFYFVYLFFLF